MKSYSTGYISS